MSILTELTARMEEYQAAETTAGVLQDISALRASAIRREFEKNKAFYEEIRTLYEIIHSQAKKYASVPIESKGKPKKMRQLFVAITSNKRFYGSLMHGIIARLATEMDAEPEATCLILGRVGWQHFEALGDTKRARQIILADDSPTPQEYRELLSYLDSFDRIIVLYPKFINTFRQEVALQDITQSFEAATEAPIEVEYIFEPEVPAMLSFFDTQVRRVLFDRVLLEAELARTSARFVKMEEAERRANRLVITARARMRREVAAVSNAGLLETFSGYTTWHQT